MADLTTEVLLDEPGFFRLVRVGNWFHVFDYADGTGEWYYKTDSLTGAAPYIIAKIGGDHDLEVDAETRAGAAERADETSQGLPRTSEASLL